MKMKGQERSPGPSVLSGENEKSFFANTPPNVAIVCFLQ